MHPTTRRGDLRPRANHEAIVPNLMATNQGISAQHGVQLTVGTRRVFRQYTWLEAGSVKAAFSRPASLG
jgi:hypothetical protein